MPYYEYINEETGEKICIFQKMNEDHSYCDQFGKSWRRLFSTPQLNTNSTNSIDPFSKKAFIEATNKKGTVGDVLDLSAELSEKRAQKSNTGEDPVKRNSFSEYEKRVGKKHFSDKPKKISSKGVEVEF